ncbi:BTB domain-containing protein [Mycena venus]|uniref:BTB domain-containing protein n=1 Tax=Mycena venus TaxID=2733690 RepID=A0A8H7D7I0_9AGAR|nr:BTB domain-containing protein [Mycena venus]
MASPPPKRQRTDEGIEEVLCLHTTRSSFFEVDIDVQDEPITRSSIWYDDGSVVLQAEHHQFRVHWSVLTHHSSFFRDMRGLPQPPDQPSVDGCPIVELQDVVADVEHLLKALYNPTFLLQKALPLPVLSALIRLCKKYDFRDMLESTVDRLTFENPTTLDAFDALTPDGAQYKTTRILHYPGVMYDMLTVARENNIQSALPCAYFRAVLYGNKRLFDGVGQGVYLTPVDQRRCILGREALLRVQAQDGYTFGWLHSADGNCTDPARCNTVTINILRKTSLDLYVLSRPSGGHSGRCPSCHQHRQDSWNAGRKRIWEELPSFFELRPWSELTNDL